MNTTQIAIPEMFFDRGSLNQAGYCALKLGAKNVFLVSDSSIEATGCVKRLTDILKKERIKWDYYPTVSSHPMDFQVERGAEIYRKKGADVIIAIGDGNALDTARSIATIASNGGKVSDYVGVKRFRYSLPPMMFITTAAGSTFELSEFCIITGWPRLQHIIPLN